MKKDLPIILGLTYLAYIKNFNHNDLKSRPVIILKISSNKVLALQLTSSNDFSNPRAEKLDPEVLKWFKDNKIKGYSFGASHWIYKKKLTHIFLQNGKRVRTPNHIKYKIFNFLKKMRRKQIYDKEQKILQYLAIHTKTRFKNDKYFKMAHNELKWIIKHNITTNKYFKIKDQKKYLKKLLTKIKIP